MLIELCRHESQGLPSGECLLLQLRVLGVVDGSVLTQLGEFGELVRGRWRLRSFLNVLPERGIVLTGCLGRILTHAITARDEVDEYSEVRQDDDED